VKRGAIDHFKAKRLARALNVPLYAANGLVERLFHFVAEHAPRGDVGRLSDQDIADALAWDRQTGELVESLVAAGWLDPHPECRLSVHDWHEHSDDGVHAKVARGHQLFVDGAEPRLRKLEAHEREAAKAIYANLRERGTAGAPADARRGMNGASPPPPPPPPPTPPERESGADGSLSGSREEQESGGFEGSDPEGSLAPQRLDDADRAELESRAKEHAPTKLRALRKLELACLAYWRSKGARRVSWLEAVWKWVLDERASSERHEVAPTRPWPALVDDGPRWLDPEDRARADEIARKREEHRQQLVREAREVPRS
jgi:hypothetical protein